MTRLGQVEILEQTRDVVRTPIVVGLWILSLGLLLAGIGNPPVSRTQEARVLETARQMLGTGFEGWMSPMLNGEPRMKKPPFCYWMAAAAYRVGGVSEGVGRVPSALLGWLTLGVTYALVRRLFDRRTALYSCAVLLGSMFFFRFTRMAETDPAAMFFLTLSVYLIYRSIESRNPIWPHLPAAAIALVILTKGAPAIFIGVFILGYCAIERRWDVARRFVFSGAPVTLLLIAAPWFYLVDDSAGSEMANTLRGGDHFGWPWYYIPALFGATAPWSLVLPLAVFEAFRRWRADVATRFVLIWLLSILTPLCINGNKQNHYLVMLMPPLMVLIGVLLANVPANLERAVKAVLVLTTIGCAAGVLVGPAMMAGVRGELFPIDWIAAAALAAAALVIGSRLRQGLHRAIPATIGTVALLMPLIVGSWLPTRDPHTARDSASDIRQVYGDRNFVFFGRNISLPLCFYLREAIPSVQDGEELLERSNPGTVAIAITKGDSYPPALPQPFVYRLKIQDDSQTLALYEFESLEMEPIPTRDIPPGTGAADVRPIHRTSRHRNQP